MIGVNKEEIYDGKWIGDSRNGIGACQYINGDVYDGLWLQDKKSGQVSN